MSHDIDTRGGQAGAGLRAAIEAAELEVIPPRTSARRSRPLVVGLRPALVVALLLIGSAVGVAIVIDSSPTPTTLPPVNTTTVGAVTTVPALVPPAPPTTAYTPPVAPPTTASVDLVAPHLEITFPEEGAHFETKDVTFRGITEPGARVFAGKYEADVDSSGIWQIALVLSEGSNRARFTARDAAGNVAEATVTVHYDLPQAPTTTAEQELAEFTAFATFGSCSETPPYDIYYGDGEPGSTVTITSEFGSASTKVNAEGHWEKKVIFETAAPGEFFLVTISDEFGRSKQFEFVYSP